MIEFKNLQENPAENTLYPAEIGMVKAAVEQTLKAFRAENAAGTFIVDGQPNGGEAQCILRADLPGGNYQVNFGSGHAASGTVAAFSIDDVLEWPYCLPRYAELYPEEFGTKEKPRTDIPTGYYSAKTRSVMVLNTTCGRFLISAKVKDGVSSVGQSNYDGGEVAEAIMRVIAMTITQLCQCKQDTVLRESEHTMQMRLAGLRENHLPKYMEVWEKVCCELFGMDVIAPGAKLEATKIWEEWREQVEGQELKLFFQE